MANLQAEWAGVLQRWGHSSQAGETTVTVTNTGTTRQSNYNKYHSQERQSSIKYDSHEGQSSNRNDSRDRQSSIKYESREGQSGHYNKSEERQPERH